MDRARILESRRPMHLYPARLGSAFFASPLAPFLSLRLRQVASPRPALTNAGHARCLVSRNHSTSLLLVFKSATERAFLLVKTRAWRVLLSPHLRIFEIRFLSTIPFYRVSKSLLYLCPGLPSNSDLHLRYIEGFLRFTGSKYLLSRSHSFRPRGARWTLAVVL